MMEIGDTGARMIKVMVPEGWKRVALFELVCAGAGCAAVSCAHVSWHASSHFRLPTGANVHPIVVLCLGSAPPKFGVE